MGLPLRGHGVAEMLGAHSIVNAVTVIESDDDEILIQKGSSRVGVRIAGESKGLGRCPAIRLILTRWRPYGMRSVGGSKSIVCLREAMRPK